MALKCKNGTCIAGKRLSRKKIVKLIPEHKKYVEPFAGNAWVYREGVKQNKTSQNAIISDINCKTTKHLKKEFGDRYQCGKDYKDVIKKHDNKDTFFFIDPPYPNACKLGYYDKHCDVNHDSLKRDLDKIVGKFILTTSVDQKDKFCKDFKCKTIVNRGMFGRKLKDLVVSNY